MAVKPLIDIQNITFRYRYDKLALDGATLSVPAGTRIALVGPNGAGKSTLFLHINGILQPQSGTLSYQGKPYSYSREFINELRQKVGLVFQDPDTQLFASNVLEDVIFGPANMGLSPAEARRRAEAALAEVEMADAVNEPVHFLSQGQKKRVAIAGVLAMNPEVLVMDEPTAGLDYSGVISLRAIMARLHASGKTLLVATHDIDWAWSWADLVYVMAQGKVIAGGNPRDILNSQQHAELGYARPIVGEIYSAIRPQHTAGEGPDSRMPRTVQELIALLQDPKR
jgi:cobalt/nickel transport system ATP-binding protein